jgi:DDE superfamily endonuclease
VGDASFHHSERIEQMCLVKLLYLPPYSPDLNPIEEFFAELMAFIKKQWHEYEDSPHQDFRVFLEWCVGVVGGRDHSTLVPSRREIAYSAYPPMYLTKRRVTPRFTPLRMKKSGS